MKKETVDTIPAVVLAHGYTGLGMLRALAMAGIPAYIACPARDLCTRSRWYRPWPGQPFDGALDNAAAAIEALPFERMVLLPGADNAARWIAARAEEAWLDDRIATCIASPQTLEALGDKRRLAEALVALDVPHPRTYPLPDPQALAQLDLSNGRRWFLKPEDSQRFQQTLGFKGLWIETIEQAHQAWHRLAENGLRVVAQEYVPGPATEHFFIDGFCDSAHRVTAALARRRLRIHPPDFGNSAYCETVSLTDVAQAAVDLQRLLLALDYRGIFSAEFKRDPRDGAFRLLEVNLRAWWYVEYAARCGINVCALAWQDALGLAQPATSEVRLGRGCVNLPADLRALRSDPLVRPSVATLLRQWARAHYHVFRHDDPMPAAYAVAGEARGWWAKRRAAAG